MTGITNQFKIGDTISFANDQNEIIQGTFMSYCGIITFAKVLGSDGCEYERKVTQIKFLSRKEPEAPKVIQATLFQQAPKQQPKQTEKPQTLTAEKMQKYNVNQRFSFLESYVRMTAKGFRNSLIITGEGGLGKTYTVEKTLESLGLIPCDEDGEGGDYIVIGGCSTAKGLYDTLREHRDRLLVFDDCDDVLLIKKIRDIFKGALDSKDKRMVSWVVSDKAKGRGDANRFEFTGRIIFISNLPYEAVDKPLLTRATFMNLVLSIDEKIERMRFVANGEGYRPLVPCDLKQEALGIIEENKYSKKLSMRTLLEAFDFIEAGEENWQDLLKYSMQ